MIYFLFQLLWWPGEVSQDLNPWCEFGKRRPGAGDGDTAAVWEGGGRSGQLRGRSWEMHRSTQEAREEKGKGEHLLRMWWKISIKSKPTIARAVLYYNNVWRQYSPLGMRTRLFCLPPASQCVNSLTEAARARALLTAREARLPTNDGSYTSFWWLIDIPKRD